MTGCCVNITGGKLVFLSIKEIRRGLTAILTATTPHIKHCLFKDCSNQSLKYLPDLNGVSDMDIKLVCFTPDPEAVIEHAARICYQSTDKTPPAGESTLLPKLLAAGQETVD